MPDSASVPPSRIRRRRFIGAASLPLLVSVAPFASASNDVGVDGIRTSELAPFLARLQAAVTARDVAGTAALIEFPLQVNTGPGKVRRIDAAALPGAWDSVFMPPVKAALAAQQASELFRNGQGAMIGNGQLWLGAVCADRRCTSSRLRLVSVSPTAR